MATKFKRITVKKKRQDLPPPGTSPGSLQVFENALRPRIFMHSFSAQTFHEREVSSLSELKQTLSSQSAETHWIDIRGLGDSKLLKDIQEEFAISSLVLEDIIHTHQRPKLEEYPHYLFATSRMLCLDKNHQLENEQISFIVTESVVLTFQENYEDCLDPVRKRLREGKGNIRISGPSYIMYALMDIILDNYFLLLNRFGDELDTLEERLYKRPDKSITFEAQQIKKAFITVRRAAWPERDKINDMIRSSSPLISKNTRTFLRDVYDHSIQIIDLVESYKEIATSLVDLYLSFVGNRTNEVMRVLTVISSVFIPLTFIAGVYGMNFAYQDPKTGKTLPENMPELYSPHGYPYALIAMGVVALLQFLYFWRKGWLK